MSKCGVIISGGALDDAFCLDVLKEIGDRLIIGVDAGVKFLYHNHILPDYIVGDFDSLSDEIVTYYKEETKVPIREFNPVKDASDTEIATRLGMTLGCEKLVILGATGNRMDHMWANVQSLSIALEAGIQAEILDKWNRIRLIDGRTVMKREEAFGKYFSIFPLGSNVMDVSITGAKYPLSHYTLTSTGSMCVSNEFASDEVVIDFLMGTVILMETRDKSDIR